MKKNYLLLATALMVSVTAFSQEKNRQLQNVEQKTMVSEFSHKNSKQLNNKVFGDTMAYFDFNGSLPTGWSIYNNSNNTFDWIWSTSAPRGQFTNAPAISSTTGANGFMMLEGDYYNTPIPPTGAIPMDAFFESNAIAIDSVGSVLVRFQQSFRFCCTGGSILELSVSTDGVNWTDFDVKEGVGTNVSSADPLMTEINISSVAAHQDSIYIRFHEAIASHYYWMIDDVAIVEGPDVDLVQESFITQYDKYNSERWQYYKQIPLDLMDSMFLQTNILNNGGSDINNVVASYDVSQDINCLGQPGVGVVHSENLNLGTVQSLERDTALFLTPFMPNSKGVYTVNATVSSASTDQVPNNNTVSSSFMISDTIFAKDDGTAESVVGPGGYVGFDQDGAQLLLYYEIKSPVMLTSMSYYIGNSSRVDNTSFTAEVYEYDRYAVGCDNLDDAACFSTVPVASNPFAINVDSTMRGTWVTVPAFPPVLLDTGGYVVGYTATGFTATQDFVVGRDLDADEQAPYDAQYIYDAHTFIYAPTEGYGIAGATPMMRMNFGQLDTTCLVGLSEPKTNTGFEVFPNPNNGQFSIGISSDVNVEYNLKISNMLGQNVYNEAISVANFVNKNLDLSDLEKGVYFVTLENEYERHTKKIIIK